MAENEIIDPNEEEETEVETESGSSTMLPGQITVTPNITSEMLDEETFLKQNGSNITAPSIQGVPLTNGVSPEYNTWMAENGYDPDGDFAKAKSDLEYEYMRSNSKYGETAEKLAQMGLSSAGVSDIYQLGAFNSYIQKQNDLSNQLINQKKAYRKEFNTIADTYKQNLATDVANAHNLGLQYYDTENGDYVRQILKSHGYTDEVINEAMNKLATYDRESLPTIKQQIADEAAWDKYQSDYNASLKVDIANAYNYALQFYDRTNLQNIEQQLASIGYTKSVISEVAKMLDNVNPDDLPVLKTQAANKAKISDRIYNEWDGTDEGKAVLTNKLIGDGLSQADIDAVFNESYGEGFNISTLPNYVSDDAKAVGIYSELINSGAFDNFENTDEERKYIKETNPGISDHIWNKVFKLYRRGYKLTVEDWKNLYLPQIIAKYDGQNEQDLRNELLDNGVSVDAIDKIMKAALYTTDKNGDYILKDKSNFAAWVDRENKETDAFNETVRSVKMAFDGQNEDALREQLRSEYIDAGFSPNEAEAKVDEVIKAALYTTDENGNYKLKDKSNFAAWVDREEAAIDDLYLDYRQEYTPDNESKIRNDLKSMYDDTVIDSLIERLNEYYNNTPLKQRPGYTSIETTVGEIQATFFADGNTYTGTPEQNASIDAMLKKAGMSDKYDEVVEMLANETAKYVTEKMIKGTASFSDIVDAYNVAKDNRPSEEPDEGYRDDYIQTLSAIMVDNMLNNIDSLNKAYTFCGYSKTVWDQLDEGEKIMAVLEAAGELGNKGVMYYDDLKAMFGDWAEMQIGLISTESDYTAFEEQLKQFKDAGYISAGEYNRFSSSAKQQVIKTEPDSEVKEFFGGFFNTADELREKNKSASGSGSGSVATSGSSSGNAGNLPNKPGGTIIKGTSEDPSTVGPYKVPN